MLRRLPAVLVALVLVLAACTSGATPEQLAALPDIEGVEQLASDFNDDSGSARLILLLSPT